MTAALEGLRVLDFGWGLAGSLVGLVLADNGAEVVKVEPPAGDPVRGTPAFHLWHRGKKSVALDLDRAEDRARAAGLAAAADVLVHNFRPAAAERFGLTYPALAAANPGLVYCAIGGLGLLERELGESTRAAFRARFLDCIASLPDVDAAGAAYQLAESAGGGRLAALTAGIGRALP